MKINLHHEVVNVIKDIMNDCQIEDNDDNRHKVAEALIQIGIVQFASSVGIVQSFKKAFPDSKPERLLLTKEEQEATHVETTTPLVCPNCGHKPIYLDSLNKWVCNCRRWDSSPEPETICSNCKVAVTPFHYYWKCDCSRYDRAPKFISFFPQ